MAKKRGNDKSIFLKKTTKCAKIGTDDHATSSCFKFNFPAVEHNSEELLDEVEKFKFVKSDNAFRFNFNTS